MINYISDKKYNVDDLRFYIQVPILTKDMNKINPDYDLWLRSTFNNGLWKGNYGYSFAIDYANKIMLPYGDCFDYVSTYQLAGCSLLKNTEKEKEICCLSVDTNYRRKGIASQLITNSFNILGTDKPLMVVPETKIKYLESLLKKFNFELTSIQDSKYYYNQGR